MEPAANGAVAADRGSAEQSSPAHRICAGSDWRVSRGHPSLAAARCFPAWPVRIAGAPGSIFVSIAAYRGPQLGPTIRDCLHQARYPDDLRFGVCWQHGEDEPAIAEFADPRLRVIDVPWRESRGACWARAEIMKLWDGEEFFLQLDSHHRFTDGWDARLLELAER